MTDRSPADEAHGLSVLRRMVDGTLAQPSMAGTLDFDIVAATAGEVVFEGRPSRRFLNPMGGIHGGWVAAVLDSAMGSAVMATLGEGERFTTLELKTNFTRAIEPDGPALRCTGSVISRGRRVALAEARMVDAGGRMCAHATSTCLILREG